MGLKMKQLLGAPGDSPFSFHSTLSPIPEAERKQVTQCPPL